MPDYAKVVRITGQTVPPAPDFNALSAQVAALTAALQELINPATGKLNPAYVLGDTLQADFFTPTLNDDGTHTYAVDVTKLKATLGTTTSSASGSTSSGSTASSSTTSGTTTSGSTTSGSTSSSSTLTVTAKQSHTEDVGSFATDDLSLSSTQNYIRLDVALNPSGTAKGNWVKVKVPDGDNSHFPDDDTTRAYTYLGSMMAGTYKLRWDETLADGSVQPSNILTTVKV